VRFAELRARPLNEHGEARYGMATLVDVTDRVQAQQSRDTIIGAALDGIVAIDGRGAITVFNAAAERIFGHRAEDVMGKPLAQILIPPESRAAHLAGVRGVQENRVPLTGTTTRVTAMRADGSRFPVDITVRRTGGDPAEFTAFVHDLSEHARAERRQRDAEQLFQSVFADSAVAMAVQNINGGMVEVNDELCCFLGRTRDELLGADPAAFTHPDDMVAHDDLLATLIAAEAEGVRREKRYVRSDGATVWAFVHATLIRDESGRPRGIQKQLVDITASQRTKAQLEAVLNSLAEGVIALDGEHRCVAVNPAAETLLGYSEADLVGRPLTDLVGAEGLRPFERVAREGAAVRVEDAEFRRADGVPLPVAYSASPLETGEQRGVVVVFSDVSERKARETALRTRLEAFDVIEDIRDALREERLVLFSQPIRNLVTGEVDQCELLLRMIGRDGEMVPPGNFLPVAEEYGLIADIDRWVIGRAAEIAATGRHVEVNISGVTLGNRDLVYWVEEALASSGADPRLMTFEITETALTNDLEQASRFAEHVASLGCGFALDDFGTGYGSFTLLKRLPVSYLKIDMEFVRDLVDDAADRHVVGAVIALAKGLGMRTIAEGIEEPETLALLTEMGVDFGQGYLIGRPAPLEES
jgi:PAS domain S-box-containing protein